MIQVETEQQWDRFIEYIVRCESARFRAHRERAAPLFLAIVRRDVLTGELFEGGCKIIATPFKIECAEDKQRALAQSRAICFAGDAIGSVLAAQSWGVELREGETPETSAADDDRRIACATIAFEHQRHGTTLLHAPMTDEGVGRWEQLAIDGAHGDIELLTGPHVPGKPQADESTLPRSLAVQTARMYVRDAFDEIGYLGDPRSEA